MKFILSLFNDLTEEDKTIAVKSLVSASTPSKSFFLFIVLSVAMATFGVLQGNTIVVIGSMLIAPMLYPILGISLGLVMSDNIFIARSVLTVGKSILFADKVSAAKAR